MAIGIRGEYPNPAKSPWSFERYHSDLERRMMDRLERDPRVAKWMKRHGITIPWIDGRSNNAAMCPIFSWSTKMVGRRSSKLRTPVALIPARCNASASRLRCGASSGTWSTGDRHVPNRCFRRTCLPCCKPSKKHKCQKKNLHVSPWERTSNPSANYLQARRLGRVMKNPAGYRKSSYGFARYSTTVTPRNFTGASALN
jgi:hypothetical protein